MGNKNKPVPYKKLLASAPPFFWNFRLGKTTASEKSKSLPCLDKTDPPQCNGWEVRYFWDFPDAPPVIIPAFEPHMFDIRQYNFIVHTDLYLVPADASLNIKIRKDEILVKRHLFHQDGIDGFAQKDREHISNESPIHDLSRAQIEAFLSQLQSLKEEKVGPVELCTVTKESMLISLKTVPAKIELSKIYVNNQAYLSLCIESRTFEAADHLKNSLNINIAPCSYINFLKGLKL